MAVPSSGSLSLFGIAKEVHLDNYNNTVPAPGSGGTNWSQLGYPSISLGNMSTGAGGFDAINTANASADRPNGSTPHSMSEFYAYDHDKSALTLMTTITGQQHSSSSATRTTFSYNANAFKGKTIRVLFHYQSGSSYRGDFQIDNIKLPFTSAMFGSTIWTQYNVGFGSNTAYSGAVFDPMNGYALLGNMQTTRTDTTSHTTATWYDITTTTTNTRWNGRSGGTPSGSTGLTTMLGYYAYAEVSSAFNENFWMRTPEWDIPNEVGSANIGFDYGAYGSNMGTLKAYIQEI